jgi:hypothetical protein
VLMRTLRDKLIDLPLGTQPQQAVLIAWEGTEPDKAARRCVIEHNAVLRESRFRKGNICISKCIGKGQVLPC